MAIPTPPPPGAARAASSASEQVAALALEQVAQAIARLRYGAIGLTVHDGRVVQLEVTERHRFT